MRLAAGMLWLCAASLCWAATPEEIEFFESQIRPLLSTHCHSCHSSKAKTSFAGLHLDTAEGLRKGSDSGPVIIAGDPNASRLLQAVQGKLAQPMPPGGKLKDDQIALLERWIKMGAPWPTEAATRPPSASSAFDLEARRREHWAWQPVQPATPPPLANVAHPIDRFLQQQWQAKSLQPAGKAPATALLRRLFFDLTGLPPSPADIAAFQRDSSPQAYKALVDRLIASPAFGERWARRWMDIIRYSESHGSEGDPDVPEAWRYRDYLIRAFNQDIPYDQLIREHIAGDLLPQPRIDQTLRLNESLLATGHLRMIEHGFQPVDPWEDRVKWTDNQVDVLSKAFQGLTVSCARCHDHKFDAIAQKDFYALFGTLAGARPTQVAIDAPAVLLTHRDALAEQKTAIQRQLAAAWKQAVPAALTKLPQTAAPNEPRESPAALYNRLNPLSGQALQAAWREEAAHWQQQIQARKDFNTTNFQLAFDARKDYQHWIRHGTGSPAHAAQPGAFSIAAKGDRVIDGIYPGGVYSHLLSNKHNAVVSTPRFRIDTDAISFRALGGNLSFVQLIIENYAVPRGGIYHMRVSPKTSSMGWSRWDTTYWKGFTAYVEFATHDDVTHFQLDPDDSRAKPKPSRPKDGRSWFGAQQIVFHNNEHTPQDVVLPVMALLGDQPPPTTPAALQRLYATAIHSAIDAWLAGSLSESQAALLDWLVRRDLLPVRRDALPSLHDSLQAYRSLEQQIPVARRAPGVVEEAPPPQPLLVRGNHKIPGDLVPQRYLTALGSQPYADRATARLRLAEEIASPNNPLTARVMVNRIWQSVFRRGLVRTVDNFGKLGDPPTHPELLDYLATRFVADGWSIKKMVRLLVTSDAYQRDSQPTPLAKQLDPGNELLTHLSLRRLQAEEIRDAILTASGELDPAMYGPSIDTYYAHDTGKTKGDKPKGPLDGKGRRSVYLEIRRNVTHPFLEVFDVPKPSTTRGERDVTTVPAQSLALLNSDFVIDQSTKWAQRLDGDTPAARVHSIFLRALGRPPTPAEQDQTLSYAATLATEHNAAIEDSRVWRDVAHAVFNLKEFLYVR
jgi:hypothetical protein